MLITTTLTTAIWLTVTLLTAPESNATLAHFYRQVTPSPLGWTNFATQEEKAQPSLRYHFFHWVLGFTLVYATLFGVGNMLFGRMALGLVMLVVALSSLGTLFWSLERRGWGAFQ